MRRVHLAVVLGIFSLTGAASAQDVARYSGNGITFDYPKLWTVKVQKLGEIAHVRVRNDKGTQTLIQLHPAGTDPKAIRDMMVKSFKMAIEGNPVQGSEKAAKRRIADNEQEGIAMDIEVSKGVTVHYEMFAFPLSSKKQVACVAFQHAALDADAAKKGFDLIAGSLAESGGTVKPPEKK